MINNLQVSKQIYTRNENLYTADICMWWKLSKFSLGQQNKAAAISSCCWWLQGPFLGVVCHLPWYTYISVYIYIHVCVSVNVHLYSALQLRVDSHMLIALGEDDGERDEGRGLWEKGWRRRTVGTGMKEEYCGKRDEGRGLWGKGWRKRTVGERDEGRGLWGKGMKEEDCGGKGWRKRTVGKGMKKDNCGGKGMKEEDCGERDEGRGLWGKGMKEDVWGGERDEGRGLWGKGCERVDDEAGWLRCWKWVWFQPPLKRCNVFWFVEFAYNYHGWLGVKNKLSILWVKYFVCCHAWGRIFQWLWKIITYLNVVIIIPVVEDGNTDADLFSSHNLFGVLHHDVHEPCCIVLKPLNLPTKCNHIINNKT